MMSTRRERARVATERETTRIARHLSCILSADDWAIIDAEISRMAAEFAESEEHAPKEPK